MTIHTQIDLMGMALGYFGQTIFLTVALWIMLKIQDLPRNILAVAGCAALACALDLIPYIGLEISLVVLLICITKLIRARTFTDAIFTAGIAYAITFAFNLFVIGALIGDLRLSSKVRARTKESEPVAQETAEQPEPAKISATPASPATNNAAQPAPLPPVVAVQPLKAGMSNAPDPVFDTNQLQSAKLAGEVLKHFAIKGISQSATMNIAMIGNGTKTYNVAPGDTIQLDTSGGTIAVKCESVTEDGVKLSVDGVQVTLGHK